MLTAFDECLDSCSYPVTTAEIIDRYGEILIDLPNGTETIADVLARLDDETFESSDDVRLAIYSAVSQKAIGRVGYSDRDPAPLGSPYAPTPVSF